MKKSIFLFLALFALASCSQKPDKPFIEKDAVELDCRFSHIDEAGHVFVFVETRVEADPLICSECFYNKWVVVGGGYVQCLQCGAIYKIYQQPLQSSIAENRTAAGN